jgi:GNAT superfamily N-acetyltransferase
MLELRRATLDDADDMAETLRQGFASYRAWAGPTYTPPPPAGEADRLRETLQRPHSWAVIARDEGRMAGHASLSRARESRDGPVIPGVGYLWQLFVREPWWGSGLATRLHALLIEEAERQGYASMRLLTPRGQARARAFYEREGWITDGEPVFEPMLGIELVLYTRGLAGSGARAAPP